jgi:hypothetical protein
MLDARHARKTEVRLQEKNVLLPETESDRIQKVP